ncbi:MAG: pyridoxamine 5-phosphate oxidase-related FMN-binding [Thermoleophilia bacterium]|nr:pyridoxamine 5-phosphate oxidase-related FMN-binding [Thermoleophilia bacterium]
MATKEKSDLEKLGELIEGIDVTMLTTRAADGSLRSRPMSTQQFEFDGTLWFLTSSDSHKVAELEANPEVMLAYADTKAQNYVAVNGRARITKDQEKVEQLWTPWYSAWFEDERDPRILLLAIDVDHAEYWEGAPTSVYKLVGLAKAAVGKGDAGELGEQGSVDL